VRSGARLRVRFLRLHGVSFTSNTKIRGMRVFGDKTMLREWFNQVIQFAEALTLAGDYHNFGDVARAAFTRKFPKLSAA